MSEGFQVEGLCVMCLMCGVLWDDPRGSAGAARSARLCPAGNLASAIQLCIKFCTRRLLIGTSAPF